MKTRPIDRVLDWCKEKGISQRQFSKAIGVSAAKITRVRQSKAELQEHEWRNMTHVYGLRLEWILTGELPVKVQEDRDEVDHRAFTQRDHEEPLLSARDDLRLIGSLSSEALERVLKHRPHIIESIVDQIWPKEESGSH